MAAEILLGREGGVATIALAAPERRNALTRAMARELVSPVTGKTSASLRREDVRELGDQARAAIV